MKTEILAGIFKALSEPVRLRILHLLMKKGELCVCDLVETLGISQSVISRHLAYLRNHDILKARREGLWMYYQLTDISNSELQPLLVFVENTTQNCQLIKLDLEKLNQSKGC